jgi:transposase
LIALARDGSMVSRVTRRANALVRLDDGESCQEVAEALLFDDDTIRGWHALFEQSGIEGLSAFDVGGSSGLMNAEQAEGLKAWVNAVLPRSTRHVGGWIAKEFGLVYESRSGLIALMHRLGLEYHKPEVISRKLDEEKQKAQIAIYEDLLNSKGDDEVVVFADAVHPTHAVRPAGCWAPKEQNLAIEQTSGRERINIHGRDRSGNRPDPHDRGRNGRRRIDDQAAGIIGIAVPFDGLHPRFPGQRALPPRQTGERMAVAAGLPDQAAFPPRLLPASEPDRAAVGRHAQEHHAQ